MASPDLDGEIAGRRVAFVGKLGSFSRQEAHRVLREHHGLPVRRAAEADIVVLGADEMPWAQAAILDEATRTKVADGTVQLLSETQFWERLGLLEAEESVRRLYTPAMLADLMGVTVRVIRGWHRRGLITPVREVHRLPYFDFQEVASAKHLAKLLAAGASPDQIAQSLAQWAQLVPNVDRPLAQLSIIMEGRQLLLRQEGGLIEPGGQLRFDFDALEAPPSDAIPQVITIPIRSAELLAGGRGGASIADMLHVAGELEDVGDYDGALEVYRTVLMAGGPQAEVAFRLAELLYLQGDLSAARERYACAIELEEDFVEARANLGCVLADLGETELAAAAFRGALKLHPDYPDAHYHLAQVLETLQEREAADRHWQEFIRLSPDSPWAAAARERLGDPDTACPDPDGAWPDGAWPDADEMWLEPDGAWLDTEHEPFDPNRPCPPSTTPPRW